MRCGLCSYEFDVANMVCHTECPLGSSCNLICCPNCGYQVVDESRSKLANFIRRIWPASSEVKVSPQLGQYQKNGKSAIPLTHIPTGKRVKIQEMVDMSPKRLAQLSAFGLVPDSWVEVIQCRPAHVIRIGETELALGKEIMKHIWVRPGNK